MVKSIKVEQYKKLNNIKISFDKGVNVISGTNGTCKTSLLHIVSNSFKAPKSLDLNFKSQEVTKVINAVNSKMNAKIEWLSKGDKKYNDPTNGKSGTVYSVEYFNNTSLDFRKHNSQKNNRYAMKPLYSQSGVDKLPPLPVIYQSLSRLVPYGEFQNDKDIKKIKTSLPEKYIAEVNQIYKKFTNIDISQSGTEAMGDIKKRTEFSSRHPGIDSNTISSGEDNLYSLLISLVSLKYYYECLHNKEEYDIYSIYLIDEFDSSLHPSLQIGLMKLLKEYSSNFKIQIFLTTHSLDLLEYSFKKQIKVTYLIDNVDDVHQITEPDIYKIRMHLKGLTKDNLYANKVIPVFTEDPEARELIDIIFKYFKETKNEFRGVSELFHFVNSNFSAEALKNMFADKYLQQSTVRSICILDGDQKESMNNSTITLPGKESPEKFIFDYSKRICDENQSFWKNDELIDQGYSKSHYKRVIEFEIDAIQEEIKNLSESGLSTKGKEREMNKKVFNTHIVFFRLLFTYWINCPSNKTEVDKFYTKLNSLFKKVCGYHQINSNEWNIVLDNLPKTAK